MKNLRISATVTLFLGFLSLIALLLMYLLFQISLKNLILSSSGKLFSSAG